MKSSSSRSSVRKQSFLGRLWREKRTEGLILLSVAATVAVMVWVISNRPIGIAGEWTWPTRVVIGARFWTPLGAVALLIAAAGWLTRPNRWERMTGKRRAVWVIWLVLVAWLLAAGILLVPQSPVLLTGGIIASSQATSYFSAAVEIGDLPAALKNFPALMEKLPLHARTHPPGPVIFFWGVDHLVRRWPALEKGLEALCLRLDKEGTQNLAEVLSREFGFPLTRSDALAAVLSAFLLAGAGSLSLFPLYGLAASLYNPTTAMRTILLFATVPSFLLFAPSIDQLVLLFAVLLLWGFHLLRKTGSPLVGLFLALGLLISLGLVVMLVFIGLWRASEGSALSGRPGASGRRIFAGLLGAAALFFGVFALLRLALGLNFPEVIRAGLAVHRHITLEEVGRTYWKWVIYDPVEFGIFLGMPVVIWAIGGVRRGFALAWLGTLVLLDLSGWVRAETGRIWLFLMPPAAMLAANRLGETGKRFDLAFFSALVLQIGQAMTMKAGLDIFILK